MIFYRSASGKCPIEQFVEDLPVEDAKEVVASIAALREMGNTARRPPADYLDVLRNNSGFCMLLPEGKQFFF